MIPLQHNESYWLLDANLVNTYRDTSARHFTTYPDYRELRRALANYAGVVEHAVLPTAGSDAALRLIAEWCVSEGKRALLPVPTFYGYERIFSQVGLAATPLYYREDEGSFIFPTDEVIAALKRGESDVVFLCQPNNPLGCLIPEQDLRRVLEAARMAGAVAVLDEAYFEFSGSTMVGAVDSSLIILRTLSKAFGLSGARVGYCVADAATIERLRARMLPWPIAHASVAAALAALDRAPRLRERVAELIEVRDRFATALAANELYTVYSSRTNFLLIKAHDARRVQNSLLHQGIEVALGEPMSAFPDAKHLLHNTIRSATPSPDDLDRVVVAFHTALDK